MAIKKMVLVKRPRAYAEVGLNPQKTYTKSELFKALVEEKLVNKSLKTRFQNVVSKQAEVLIPYFEQIERANSAIRFWRTLSVTATIGLIVVMIAK